MSKFEVQFFDDLEARLIKVTEPVNFAEVINFFENELERRVIKNTIWEFEAGVLQFLNLDELKRFMAVRRSNIERRHGGNTVMIVNETSERMLVKWYQTFAEGLPFHDVKFHMARSLDEAASILRARQQISA